MGRDQGEDKTCRPALRLEQQPLNFEGTVVSVYPDFILMVQKAQKKYLAVKQKLRQVPIPYDMLCLAGLCVTYKGKEQVFANL
ncbi:hypothetical protein NDU88_002496 [Pleurodeles waltl]|uniref:Uncharacterized protein n=1 Tax=Pleurodeles waltl TaxID=8319 RepID=A0AAV7NI38_PLEWA|nr:hypothetical protein NDU88_002496 [Pleurodeles waltl]